jgi:hypothetical protein
MSRKIILVYAGVIRKKAGKFDELRHGHLGRNRSFTLKLRLVTVKCCLPAVLQVIAVMVFW